MDWPNSSKTNKKDGVARNVGAQYQFMIRNAMIAKCRDIIRELKKHKNSKNVEGMKRFGINSKNMLGLTSPDIKKIAKKIGKDHSLALELWQSNIYEARILACDIDDPDLVTEKQMDAWVSDFDSWAACDACCGHLFDRTNFAYKKAKEWSKRKEEYIKRAGFAMMACLAVHDKKAKDEDLLKFFPLIKKGSIDERNFVHKAVNWALRQIGKRNLNLNKKAIGLAEEIQKIDSKSAKWIAADALRELKNKSKIRNLS